MKNPFKRKYLFQGMVQFESTGDEELDFLTICGDRVLWLDKLEITEYTCKRVEEKAFEILENKYPEYTGFLQLI